MMNVTDILSHSSSALNASADDRYQATKDQFLNLLLAQLKNQDPLDAPDVNKLSEQITSFGQLEQLMNLNKTMEGVAAFQGGQERSQAVTLIGKSVQVSDNTFDIAGLETGKINYRLNDDADESLVLVKDFLGRVVRTIRYENEAQGSQSHEFDGLADDGTKLQDGTYTIEVEARKSNGVKVGVSTVSEGIVDDVVFGNQGTIITVNGRSYGIGQVVSVRQPEVI